MPVARPRGMDDRTDYVIVRRTGADGEEVVNNLETRFEPTSTVDQTLDLAIKRRQLDLSKLDFDTPNQRKEEGYDSDDDDKKGPPPFVATVTLPQAQATGGALANQNPAETVVVQITPPPPPPREEHHRGGISQTTEHLLIAAGSIGATIILVMLILAIHTMRKRGLTLREAVTHGKNRVTRRGGPPTPPKQKMWEKEPSPYSADYGSMRNDTVTPPQRAMSIERNGSTSSQRPLMAVQRSESFNNRSASPGTVPQSFLLDSPPSRNISHRRDNSATPSSPVLPVQNQRRSISTRNTRSISEDSELQFPQPPQERSLSPLPPPPTFKQFLFNRPSVSGRPGFGGGMTSRFSWTNSNAPQTPHDPSRDTNSHTIGRDSFMTQRSSVPRFRTVDSWVAQQSTRIEEQKLREQFRMTQTTVSDTSEYPNNTIPEVPEIPRNVSASAVPPPLTRKPTLPSSPNSGLPGKNIRHERHDTRTTVDTAPIFRQHPGTEVRFSTRSAVPSEILDRGRTPNVLS